MHSARVCIASYELLGPSRNGGIGTGYSALAGALAEAGHQVTLLYLFGNWGENGTVSEWQAYYRDRGIQFCPLPASTHPLDGPQNIRISFDAYQWLKARDFDVIPSCSDTATIASWPSIRGWPLKTPCSASGCTARSPGFAKSIASCR
jgi:hypothetical protein